MAPRIGIIALCQFLLCGCGHLLDTSTAVATTRYQNLSDGRIVIEAAINDQGTFRFAIDTAASISVIYEPLRHRLGLGSNRDIRVQGLISKGLFPLTQLDRVAIGDSAWNSVDVVILPADSESANEIDGILGLDFLEQYTLVLSTSQRQVHLFEPEQLNHDKYAHWVAIDLEKRQLAASDAFFFFVDLQIARHHIPAVFDLGAGINMLNRPAAQKIGLPVDDSMLTRKREKISGAIGSAPDLIKLQLSEVRTGRMRWRRQVFLVGDIPIFETLVETGQPAAILGAGLFLNKDLVIDFSHTRLLVNTRTKRPEMNTPDN